MPTVGHVFRTAFFAMLAGLTAVAQGQQPGPLQPAAQPGALQPGPAAGGETAPTKRQAITRVTRGTGALPNDHGQVWREYDIRPYTSRVTTTKKPEQAIVDWILRETGTEIWFSEPLGILSADRNTLRVYHTPEMQQLVLDIVDRFVNSEADSHSFGVRLITVRSPNWRTRALPMLTPVNVQTPGVQAWLLSKEHAAVFLGELSKRTDFAEHGSPNLLIHNGQSHTIARHATINYARSIRFRNDVWPGYQLDMGQIDSGYSLQLSPLLSIDGATIDAVIKCQVDQLEKFEPVHIDVPSATTARQRVQIQVPRIASWRIHERFRWPADKVLLISCGVVATPDKSQSNFLGISNPFAGSEPPRADALLLLEGKGKAPRSEANSGPRVGARTYHGRY